MDNGSTDGSQELVRRTPSIKLVALLTNEGFASAVNVGVGESASEFIALVNNDVELDADWLQRLLTEFVRDRKVVAVTGKLLFKNQPTVVNDLGAIVLLNGSGIHRGLGSTDTKTLKMAYAGAPSGAACLLKRKAYVAAGGFDDSYFAYFEDVDLGWRFWLGGFKVVCDPSAIAYHSWQSTSKKFGRSFRVYHCAKNSFATFLKNAQRRLLFEAFLLWSLRLLLEVVRSVKRRDPHSIVAIIKSLEWCSRNTGLILTKSLVQDHRVVSDSDLLRIRVLRRLREGAREALKVA